jgi:nicotinic acid phosphoribosyltransferase
MEYIHTNADGSTTKYTEDMIKNLIADKDYYQGKYHDYVSKVNRNREAVYEFFKDRYDSGSDEITVTVEDVNDMLESIGSEKLKVLFTVTGTIHFVITNVEADDEQGANDIVNENLTVEFGYDGDLDEWDIDISDTSQQ